MNPVMNIIVGLIFVALGVLFAFWPRALWWLRWGWLLDQKEPGRLNLLLCRACGVMMVLIGLVLAILNP